MTAIVIDFRTYHQLKRVCPDNREPTRRGRAERAARRPLGKASLDQQIAHVTWLLRELEDIAHAGERLPQVLVAEAHSSIKTTRRLLQSWSGPGTSGATVAMRAEDGPQPNIDPALLDRMYSDLGLHHP